VAALDAVAYVRHIPPFDLLPESLYLGAAQALEIALFQAGTRLVEAGGAPLRHLYVVRKGAVRLERDRQVLQVIEEGEVFGYTSLISRQASLDVVVEEDLLAYRLPDADFEPLLADPRFAAHFAVELTDRLKATLEHVHVARFEPDVAVEVAQLVRRPAVWVGADATVREAARVMRDEHISSVLLRCDPPGIVTDRDLRNRVLGADLDPGIPAAQVCSRPLRMVAAATPLYEAWRTLLDAGVNHLPIERGGEIVGVLTSTDLLRHSAQGPIAVLRRFERLSTRDALPEYGRKLTEMASALLAAGLDPLVIAGFVAQLNATLVRRLLHMAEAELGEPPAPYAWVALGAHGRQEQTLRTSQDNGLVHGDAGSAGGDWYAALAERVSRDLDAAGFPAPDADRTARRRRWPLSEWVRRIDEVAAARPWEAAPFLDLRRVAGALDLAPLEEALSRASRKPSFVRALAWKALSVEPPHMLLLRLRGASSRVHLERQGLSPIVSLARCFAVEAGSRARATVERLDDAMRAGVLSENAHSAITEAFRFLLGLRLRVQLRAISAGTPADDEVALSDLAGIERTRLKEAFRAIRRWQEAAAHRYQPELVTGPMPG
jgi:CBS domain-containing protein